MPVPKPLCAALVLAAAATAVTTGCSSSSSPGPSSAAARAAVTLESRHAAPAETFHRVTPAQAKSLQGVLPLERGVKSDAYYPGTKTLDVTFLPTANKLDQQNVENLVRQAKQGNAPASPTPRAKVSPRGT